jgi:hypothetical protein
MVVDIQVSRRRRTAGQKLVILNPVKVAENWPIIGKRKGRKDSDGCHRCASNLTSTYGARDRQSARPPRVFLRRCASKAITNSLTEEPAELLRLPSRPSGALPPRP